MRQAHTIEMNPLRKGMGMVGLSLNKFIVFRKM